MYFFCKNPFYSTQYINFAITLPEIIYIDTLQTQVSYLKSIYHLKDNHYLPDSLNRPELDQHI